MSSWQKRVVHHGDLLLLTKELSYAHTHDIDPTISCHLLPKNSAKLWRKAMLPLFG
jgi:hypothetical protein